MKKYLFLLAVIALVLVGCPSPNSAIYGITISAGTRSNGTVASGVWYPTGSGSLQLTATVLPSSVTSKTIYWSSNDSTGNVSVSTNGLVTVTGAAGSWSGVIITASVFDTDSETGYSAYFSVSPSYYQ